MPSEPLDGELWLQRKSFQRAVSIVRRQDKSEHWQELTYVVFDASGLEKGFEARMEFVREVIQANRPKHAQAHDHSPCRGIDHLKEELARVAGLGGEGLMLRKPGSRYESGRSSTLLKVKQFHDAEARVLGHQEGAGRHKGRLGALLVELADGTKFSVGTGFSDAERAAPPAIGSLITFRFQELSEAGVPRFPSYIGLRAEAEAPSAPARASKSAASKRSPSPGRDTVATPDRTARVRRFEFSDGSSNKFWEITRSGADVTVRFGRIGSDGQAKTKSFADDAAAAAYAEKLIGEKTEKGYQEMDK